MQIGTQAGYNSTNASIATQIGFQAGYNSVTGAYSTCIGAYADALTTSSNIQNRIAIGYQAKVHTPNTCVIGGTGVNAVKVTIGNTTAVNTFDVVGNISCSVITASLLFGTASWAINSISASYAPGNPSISASYALTASYAPGSPSVSASYSLTSSYSVNGGFTLTTGSTYPITSSWSINSLTTSYALSASYSTTSSYSNSSSYSLSASYALNGGSGGTTLTTGSTYPITSSWSLTSSYTKSASYSPNLFPDIKDVAGLSVGIFQTVPQYALDVGGAVGNSGTNDYLINYGGANSYLNAQGGNVGIRTTLPNYQLDVNGNVNTNATYLVNGTPFTSSLMKSSSYAQTASFALNGNSSVSSASYLSGSTAIVTTITSNTDIINQNTITLVTNTSSVLPALTVNGYWSGSSATTYGSLIQGVTNWSGSDSSNPNNELLLDLRSYNSGLTAQNQTQGFQVTKNGNIIMGPLSNQFNSIVNFNSGIGFTLGGLPGSNGDILFNKNGGSVLSLGSGFAFGWSNTTTGTNLTNNDTKLTRQSAGVVNISSSLVVNSIAHNITTQTSNYNLKSTDYTVLMSGSSALSASLPLITTVPTGSIFNIKNLSIWPVYITGSGGSLIDNQSNQIITSQYTSIQVQSDATNWWVL